MLRTKIFAACASCLMAATAHGAASCKLRVVATLPITMKNSRATISVKINGVDAQLALDSGAFYSTISSAAAAEYHLKLFPVGLGARVEGIGGSASVSGTTVKEFTLSGAALKNIEFLVGGSQIDTVGVLGQNFLQNFDVEYDLAGGVIRLFKTEGCNEAVLAYWAKPGESFSSMHVDEIDTRNPHTVGRAYVNDKEIRVGFDTGAPTSLLASSAAARAGVRLDSPGVVELGYTSGIGMAHVKTYLAPFANFKIGDTEEIRNTRLRLADVDLKFADMLVGVDFFISHRIFVGNHEHRLFMTYNGGPVFNLSKRPELAVADSSSKHSEADPSPPTAKDATDAPAEDPAAIARRGAALAARQEFGAAIAELTKAIELSPDEPEFYFLRGDAHRKNRQVDLALQDFDRVIQLKEDFLPAYIPRAEIHFEQKDTQAGLADLDTVERLAPKPADLRLTLAFLYQRVDHFSEAIAQYALWIQYHEADSRLVAALQGRCRSSALQNQALSDALDDCNAALRRADKKEAAYPSLWVDRGFVRLRLGDYERSLGDFNDAIKAKPDNAAALYGRGVVEARKGNKAASDADLAQSAKLAPKMAEHFQKFGIVP